MPDVFSECEEEEELVKGHTDFEALQSGSSDADDVWSRGGQASVGMGRSCIFWGMMSGYNLNTCLS